MLVVLLALRPAFADIPLGTPIQDAAAVDLTTKGLDALMDIASTFIPARVDVGEFSGDDCVIDTIFGCAASYAYEVGNSNTATNPNPGDIYVEVDLRDLALVPGPNNTLLLEGQARVSVNRPSDPIYLRVEGEAIGINISDTCDAWVDPFDLNLSATVGIELVTSPTGAKTIVFDVVDPVTFQWNLVADDIQVDGDDCDIDNLNEIASFFGFDVRQEILDVVEPEVDALVATIPALLEPVLNDAIPDLNYIDTIDVLGVPLDVQIVPDTLTVEPGGLRIGVTSRIEAPVDACVEAYVGDMVDTPGGLDPVGVAPASLAFAPDVIASLDDDLVNQALYALWAGGMLCIAADDDLGLPISTSVLTLGLLPTTTFDDLFEPLQMEVGFTPTQPPRFSAAGSNDLNIGLDGMGISFVADLDGRKVRALDAGLDLAVGIDVNFDPTLGELAVDIDLTEAEITPFVSYNEYFPETTPEIETKIPATIEGLFPILNPLLADLTFAVPSFDGVGVTQLDLAPAGPQQDRLGMYAGVGPVAYPEADCSDGCSSSGCSSAGFPGQLALLAGPAALVWRRRRR